MTSLIKIKLAEYSLPDKRETDSSRVKMVSVVRKYRKLTWNETAISTGGLTRYRCLLKPLAGSSPKDSSELKSHCDFTFNLWDKATTFRGYTSRRKLLCGGQMGSAFHRPAKMWPCYTPATQFGCACSARVSSQFCVDWCLPHSLFTIILQTQKKKGSQQHQITWKAAKTLRNA